MFKKYPILITTAFLLIVMSCSKDKAKTTADVLYSSWEVKSFMSIESAAYIKDDSNKILLIFDQKGTYSLVLDVNHCGGNFTQGDNDQIELDAPSCTEICCDSEFSQKLATMLPQVTSYGITGPTLRLHVPQWGYIECELVR